MMYEQSSSSSRKGDNTKKEPKTQVNEEQADAAEAETQKPRKQKRAVVKVSSTMQHDENMEFRLQQRVSPRMAMSSD